MAKSHNQKAKILFLAKMLRESGENRVLSMQDILTGLQEYGIQAERKSIYDDFEALRDFGMDVKFKRGKPGGYYIAGQKTPEAEEALDPAEPVEEPMEFDDAQQDFEEYPDSAPEPEMPAASVETEKNEWKFGRKAAVGSKPMKLLCASWKKEEVQAYFGSDAEYKEKGSDFFTVTAGQLGDPQFFGWLTAMGKDVHIVKPKKIAQAYRDYLKSLAKEYKGV